MLRACLPRSDAPLYWSHYSNWSSSDAQAEITMKPVCVKQSCKQGGNLLFKERELLGKLKQTLSKVFQSAIKGMAPGALLWYQLCVWQRSSVIFGFVFMQEWCSGWSLFQSLRVQHSLRCVAGWNNWYSVLSTVPETQQRENRLSPWGKKLSEIRRGKGV